MHEQIKKGGGGGCCSAEIFLACLGAGAGISVSISTRQVAARSCLWGWIFIQGSIPYLLLIPLTDSLPSHPCVLSQEAPSKMYRPHF